jgi:hypothetical protein
MNYLIYYGGLDEEKKKMWDGLLETCGRLGVSRREEEEVEEEMEEEVEEEVEEEEDRRWIPSDFLWLPAWIPPTEEAMITEKLPIFVKKALV